MSNALDAARDAIKQLTNGLKSVGVCPRHEILIDEVAESGQTIRHIQHCGDQLVCVTFENITDLLPNAQMTPPQRESRDDRDVTQGHLWALTKVAAERGRYTRHAVYNSRIIRVRYDDVTGEAMGLIAEKNDDA